MEENGSEKEKLTRRDYGRGFIFLGAIMLMLTVFFYIMSSLNQEYYGLFSGQTHLVFYTVLGLVFLGIGTVLVRRRPVEEEA
ncbi:MAG: hypothetical protein Q7J68_02885 [Thermoplasmata archaeon]|nr:hypothetical protein [Thermoplasmata archaeon]